MVEKYPVVWNFGVLDSAVADQRSHLFSVLPWCERYGSLADTNDSWDVEEEKAVDLLPTPPAVTRKYYVFRKPGGRIDGTLFNWDWKSGGRSNWKKAKALGERL